MEAESGGYALDVSRGYTDISDDDQDTTVTSVQASIPNCGTNAWCTATYVYKASLYNERGYESHREEKILQESYFDAVLHYFVYYTTHHVSHPNAMIDGNRAQMIRLVQCNIIAVLYIYPIFYWRWRLVVHGCIDGFSRLLVYLECADNNRSRTVTVSLPRRFQKRSCKSIQGGSFKRPYLVKREQH